MTTSWRRQTSTRTRVRFEVLVAMVAAGAVATALACGSEQTPSANGPTTTSLVESLELRRGSAEELVASGTFDGGGTWGLFASPTEPDRGVCHEMRTSLDLDPVPAPRAAAEQPREWRSEWSCAPVVNEEGGREALEFLVAVTPRTHTPGFLSWYWLESIDSLTVSFADATTSSVDRADARGVLHGSTPLPPGSRVAIVHVSEHGRERRCPVDYHFSTGIEFFSVGNCGTTPLPPE